MNIDAECRALRLGEITELQFIKATGKLWRILSREIYNGWRRKMPKWVEREDIEQELSMFALKAVKAWDAERQGAAPIGAFVIWCARHRAQRAIHKWRGARIHGNEGKNPGMPERVFSSMSLKNKDGMRDEFVPDVLHYMLPDQEDYSTACELFDELLQASRSVKEALVLLALRYSRGNPDEAAIAIFDSWRARVECGLRDEEHARTVVGGEVAKIVKRVEQRAEDYGIALEDTGRAA